MPTTTLPPARARPRPTVPRRGPRPAPRVRGTRRPSLPSFLGGGLGRRQPRDWDAVGGAAHVIHTGPVAEPDGNRVTAVLAADADLETRACGASPFDGPEHQLPDPLLVERLERIVCEDSEALFVDVVRQEVPGIIARKGHGHLGEIVGPEGEEFGPAADRLREKRRTRDLDHRSDQVRDPHALLPQDPIGRLTGAHLDPFELLRVHDERVHDFRNDRDATPAHRRGRLDDGPHLHVEDFRVYEAETAPAIYE